MTVPPKYIVERGTKQVLWFLKDCLEGTEKWPQIKIAMIGDGNAGKVNNDKSIFLFTT